MNPNTCNNIGIQDVTELDIDNLGSMPDYFLGIRQLPDTVNGTIKTTPVLVPGDKVFPLGNLANAFLLEPNNEAITVPALQVVPLYVQNAQTRNVVYMASGQHAALFLGTAMKNGLVQCQSTGVFDFGQRHQYIVGQQYYLASQEGQVTTDPTQTGQKLFVPVTDTSILINM